MNDIALIQDRLIASGLLTPQNNSIISALSPELVNTWEKRQVFRTETEMRVHILNDEKFPTPASKYWQAVREQANMLDNLAIVGFDYRKNNVQIKRLEARLAASTDPLDSEEAQIELDECLFKRASMQQNANDRMRELQLWSQIKAELDDGSFDTADVNTHQLQSMLRSLQNRRRALSQSNSSQAEVSNVIGPLKTAERIMKEHESSVR